MLAPVLVNIPQEIQFGIVDAGTSRFVVLDCTGARGALVQSSVSVLSSFLQKLADLDFQMFGVHYQDRKIVLAAQIKPHEVEFLFFQIGPDLKNPLPVYECSNAAAATAKYFENVAGSSRSKPTLLRNLSTGQRVTVGPVLDTEANPAQVNRWKIGPTNKGLGWEIREIGFLHGPSEGIQASQIVSKEIQIREKTFIFRSISLGNKFVFLESKEPLSQVDVDGPEFTIGVYSVLVSQGLLNHCDCKSIKLMVFYRNERKSRTDDSIDFRCFFHHEKHRSIPGSGAMLLCRLLNFLEPRPEVGYQRVFELSSDTISTTVALEVVRDDVLEYVARASMPTRVRTIMVSRILDR